MNRLLMLISVALTGVAVPAAAQQASYRAVGTEPGWTLTIERGELHYIGDYGETRITVPAPRPIIGINGEIYQTRRLNVSITHQPCNDGMSDRRYHDTVHVVADGKEVRGCGGQSVDAPSPPVPPAPPPPGVTVIDGSWQVQSIGGRPAIPGTRAEIRFERGRVSGSSGCNSFNGNFRFERGRLTAGPLALTRRGCGRWVQAQEQRLLQLLGQRLSVSRNRNGKLVMTTRGGSTLVLAPQWRRR